MRAGEDPGELEDDTNIDGGSDPRANTSAEIVVRGRQMEQRQKSLRPGEGAGEVDLSNEEQGHEKRKRFFKIARIERKHWNSFELTATKQAHKSVCGI